MTPNLYIPNRHLNAHFTVFQPIKINKAQFQHYIIMQNISALFCPMGKDLTINHYKLIFIKILTVKVLPNNETVMDSNSTIFATKNCRDKVLALSIYDFSYLG